MPGTGALPGAGNLPAFVTDFLAIGVTEIVVNAGDGNDTINIDSLPFFADATVRGGLGNDFIQFAAPSANLDTIAAPIHVGRRPRHGPDFLGPRLQLPRLARLRDQLQRAHPAGAGGWTLSQHRDSERSTARTATTPSTSPAQPRHPWILAGHLGNDTFNIGTVGGSAGNWLTARSTFTARKARTRSITTI